MAIFNSYVKLPEGNATSKSWCPSDRTANWAENAPKATPVTTELQPSMVLDQLKSACSILDQQTNSTYWYIMIYLYLLYVYTKYRSLTWIVTHIDQFWDSCPWKKKHPRDLSPLLVGSFRSCLSLHLKKEAVGSSSCGSSVNGYRKSWEKQKKTIPFSDQIVISKSSWS